MPWGLQRCGRPPARHRRLYAGLSASPRRGVRAGPGAKEKVMITSQDRRRIRPSPALGAAGPAAQPRRFWRRAARPAPPLVLPAAVAPSSPTPAAAAAAGLKTAKVGGVTVLTNAKGFTLYSFAPDTATKSACNGACATSWPPVKAPATAPWSRPLRHHHAIRRLDPAHLRRAPAVHLRRRFLPRTGQGQRPERIRRAVARNTSSGTAPAGSSPSGSAAEATDTDQGPQAHAEDRQMTERHSMTRRGTTTGGGRAGPANAERPAPGWLQSSCAWRARAC